MSAPDAVVELAATVRLPWAAAIRHGVKPVENRGRPVADRHIGRLIAIHAGAAWDQTASSDPRLTSWWYGPGREDRRLDAADFGPLFRRVVAVARLVDCHEAVPAGEDAACCAPWGEQRYGPDAKPAWHLVLADVVMLGEAIGPVAGKLALPWTLPGDVSELVTAEYVRSRGW